MTNGRGPLSDLLVLDLTRYLSGPYCTLQLAGMGARVIKVDHPVTGDPTVNAPPFAGPDGPSLQQTPDSLGLAYLKRQRGKESITIDLKHAKGAKLLRDLAQHADVVVENFRPGVARRLGIDYSQLKLVNPGIVYCAITGYGQTGPEAQLKSYDLMAQAAAGLMAITGEANGRPMKAGSPMADTIAGTWGALSILAALHEKKLSGVGQSIDVSMQDCLFSMMMDEPLDCYEQLGQVERVGNRVMRFSPFNAYQSADGWLVIGSVGDKDWSALCQLIGQPALADDSNYSRVSWRIENNDAVDQVIGDWVKSHTTDDAIEQLRTADIACSAVRTPGQAINSEHLNKRNMVKPLLMPDGRATGVIAPDMPFRMSRSAVGHHRTAPVPGTNTTNVLSEFLGLDNRALDGLRSDGVI
ncbi:MAG: CaiB/BaiF CoA-transferase family protein [Burkholderiaceae bacterium]